MSETSITPDAGGSTPQVLIDEKTHRPKQEIIHSVQHAYEIAKSWWEGRKFFNDKMSEIDANYHGKPPFVPAALDAHGQGNRNNWFTKPLATTIDRGVTPFLSLINGAKYLTTSELPTQIEDASEKSEKFQKAITQLVRSWPGWVDLVEAIPTEDAKFGHGCVARIDPMDWRPTYYRTDEFFVDENQSRNASDCKILILRHTFSPQRLYDLIGPETDEASVPEEEQEQQALSSRVAAENAGWNVVNLVKCINDAEPLPNPNLQESRKAEDSDMQDNIRRAHRNGMPVIEAGICLYEKLGGGINQIIFRWRDGLEMYQGGSVAKKMEHMASFTTFERGNGKVYGSRGLGHALVNIAITLDVAYCEFADAIRRRTLVPIKVMPGEKVTVGSYVQSPFFVIETTGELQKSTEILDVPLEEFDALFQRLTGLLEVIAGIYLPAEITDPGGDQTATAANLTAQRENQIRESKLSRFATQWAEIISSVQRSICHPENIKVAIEIFELRKLGFAVFQPDVEDFALEIGAPIDENLLMPELPENVDKEAVECIIEMLELGLTPVEIYVLAMDSAIDTVGESPAARAAKIQAIAPSCEGNAMVDQNKWLRMKISGLGDPAMADELVIKPADSSAKFIEASRLQKLELSVLFEPRDVEVSPNDFHAAHRAVIKDRLGELSPLFLRTGVLPTPDLAKGIDLTLAHFAMHLQLGEQGGEAKDQIKADRDWLTANEQAFKMLQQRLAQHNDGAGVPQALTPLPAQPALGQPQAMAAAESVPPAGPTAPAGMPPSPSIPSASNPPPPGPGQAPGTGVAPTPE
jgi:hypothetical protein